VVPLVLLVVLRLESALVREPWLAQAQWLVTRLCNEDWEEVKAKTTHKIPKPHCLANKVLPPGINTAQIHLNTVPDRNHNFRLSRVAHHKKVMHGEAAIQPPGQKGIHDVAQ